MSIGESIIALKSIYERYSDVAVHAKILEFIKTELPERLDAYIERIQRQEQLVLGTEAFINEFLINSETKYMYIAKSAIFVKYDGIEFKLVNESDILHKILTRVSKKKILIPWKYKITNMIMKRIKDTSLFTTIPESQTIQKVLGYLTPLLLSTKEEAKYFLTIMGDNILKKLQGNIHLINLKAKEFIKSLSDNIFSYFKNKYHIDTTIKYSWYDHPYSTCRILNFNDSVGNNSYWTTFVKYHILDIMAVAVHYSNRFGNSDKYALNVSNNIAIANIMCLTNQDEDTLLERFIESNILKVDDKSACISMKEIHYLWKKFLADNNLPSVVFMSQLKIKLSPLLELDANNDQFIGITGKYLGSSQHLREFWRDNMIYEIGEEIEVTELFTIYKNWLALYHKDETQKNSEKTFVFILEHFNEITLNVKSIKNYKCLLWNKRDELTTILNDLKITYKFSPDYYEKSIDQIYMDYCTRCTSKFNYRIINKKEFVKYINQIIPEKYIIRKRILNEFWST